MERQSLLGGDLLPGLRGAAAGLVVPPAPVHAGRGPLARPHVIGLAVPDGNAARGNDDQHQDTASSPEPEASAAQRHRRAHPASMPGPSSTRSTTPLLSAPRMPPMGLPIRPGELNRYRSAGGSSFGLTAMM